MKIRLTTLAILLGLLSIAAGGAKISLVPDEVAFLSTFGFSERWIPLFGGSQILGGLLFAIPRTSLVGGIMVLLTLALSTVLLFLAGKIAIGCISILPIILTVQILRHLLPRK